MVDIKIMVEATKQLNRAWASCSENAESDDASNLYNALCEIDEAVINLVEKVSLYIKEQSIGEMYDSTPLASTHEAIVKRYHKK